MNFKSLIAVGFGIATIGLSLPAHADTATVITNSQDSVITGNRNTTNQNINTRVSNTESRNRDNAGTAIGTSQASDVLGNRNRTNQTSTTNVINRRVGNR